jgi:hypothetical protein
MTARSCVAVPSVVLADDRSCPTKDQTQHTQHINKLTIDNVVDPFETESLECQHYALCVIPPLLLSFNTLQLSYAVGITTHLYSLRTRCDASTTYLTEIRHSLLLST